MSYQVSDQIRLRAEAFSSRIEREILKTLYIYKEFNPLRPKDIIESLPSELQSSSGSKLAYHLEKLCRAGLIERKPIGPKLTWYHLTDEGKKFYEKLPQKRSSEDAAHFLANLIVPYAKEVSERDIYNVLLNLISNKEVDFVEPGNKKKVE